MKLIIMSIILFGLMSCQSLTKQPKEFSHERNRTYLISYDSVLKKLVEFASQSKIPIKNYAFSPSLILFEENFNYDQVNKYTDFNPGFNNYDIEDSKERLLISIISDSTGTTVDIKSIINLTIKYKEYIGKATKIKIKKVECNSSGLREKEILDFIQTLS